MFSVFPVSLISSQNTDRNGPLARLTNKHSQKKTFPNRVPIELSEVVLSTPVLPEDDVTNSFREERLDLPYWTMIWIICASIGVSKYQDIQTLDFLNNL